MEDLKSIVDRIEQVESEERDLAADKKSIYDEAKSVGYDVKVLRKIIQLRRKDPNEREEEESLMKTYLNALE